jgi:hypothetical protein
VRYVKIFVNVLFVKFLKILRLARNGIGSVLFTTNDLGGAGRDEK